MDTSGDLMTQTAAGGALTARGGFLWGALQQRPAADPDLEMTAGVAIQGHALVGATGRGGMTGVQGDSAPRPPGSRRGGPPASRPCWLQGIWRSSRMDRSDGLRTAVAVPCLRRLSPIKAFWDVMRSPSGRPGDGREDNPPSARPLSRPMRLSGTAPLGNGHGARHRKQRRPPSWSYGEPGGG